MRKFCKSVEVEDIELRDGTITTFFGPRTEEPFWGLLARMVEEYPTPVVYSRDLPEVLDRRVDWIASSDLSSPDTVYFDLVTGVEDHHQAVFLPEDESYPMHDVFRACRDLGVPLVMLVSIEEEHDTEPYHLALRLFLPEDKVASVIYWDERSGCLMETPRGVSLR